MRNLEEGTVSIPSPDGKTMMQVPLKDLGIGYAVLIRAPRPFDEEIPLPGTSDQPTAGPGAGPRSESPEYRTEDGDGAALQFHRAILLEGNTLECPARKEQGGERTVADTASRQSRAPQQLSGSPAAMDHRIDKATRFAPRTHRESWTNSSNFSWSSRNSTSGSCAVWSCSLDS